jgi:hypothetical protein
MIAKFIKEQYRELPELNDDRLIANYCQTRSVKKRCELLQTILVDAGLSYYKACQVSKKLLLQFLIPAGTKSKVRGDRFNAIIAKEITICLKKLKINHSVIFDLEKKNSQFHEIPDWIITKNDKLLVGFNQISLFGGGHQINRASKYILDESMHDRLTTKNIKMVCVVKDLPIKNGGKSKDIFLKGIEKKRIYCIGGIKKLLQEYFC